MRDDTARSENQHDELLEQVLEDERANVLQRMRELDDAICGSDPDAT